LSDPFRYSWAQKEKAMNTQQIEMSFNGSVVRRHPRHRQRRLARARWWFAQMRQVVDRAWDWQAASPAPTEQRGATLSAATSRN